MSNKEFRLYNYIDIDIKTAQKLISQYDTNIEVDNLKLIPEGLSTSNYIISIKNSQYKYLLKIYPENGGNSEIEVSSYKYAKEHVNVPNIHFFDHSKKVYNRPYIIMDYIDGINLKEYVINKKGFPQRMAYNIANSLALLHNREYTERALLDKDLNIKKVLTPVSTLYEKNLDSYAGAHIRSEIKEDILSFILQNEETLKELDSKFVYSHGDFNTSNILVDKTDTIWFIDFEYSQSASVYLDIGKFFRDRADMNKYITKDVYDNFFSGYNSSAKHYLSHTWIKLAKLMDMFGMLGLINGESVPDEWVREIEEAIIDTMRILRV